MFSSHYLLKVKIWHIPEKGLGTSLTDPECVFSHKQRRVETVGFHPTADGLLHSTAAGCVTLFDIVTQKEIFCKLKCNSSLVLALTPSM